MKTTGIKNIYTNLFYGTLLNIRGVLDELGLPLLPFSQTVASVRVCLENVKLCLSLSFKGSVHYSYYVFKIKSV